MKLFGFTARRGLALFLLTALAACTAAPEEAPKEAVAPVPIPAKPEPVKEVPPSFDQVVDLTKAPQCRPKPRRKGGTGGPPTTPSSFDDMAVCYPKVPTLPVTPGILSGAGTLTPAGDCAYASNVVCHYHDGGSEFGKRGLGVGEVHCIYPTAEARQPLVLGFAFQCNKGTALKKRHGKAKAAKIAAAATCSADLLSLLGTCSAGSRCCTNGNLTEAWSKQSEADRQLRPSFAICSAALSIDCGAHGPLAGMLGHPSNDGTKIR